MFTREVEYNNFLESAISSDQLYFMDNGYVYGRDIKTGIANCNLTVKCLLTGDYINNIYSINSCLHKGIDTISRNINKIFAGDFFSWRTDTLPIVESIQGILETCGIYLPDIDELQAVLKDALEDMRNQDIYAFADRLISLESYLGRYMDVVLQDIKYLGKLGYC